MSNIVAFNISYPNSKSGLAAWNKQYSLNAYYTGKHWSVRKKDADFWHQLVHYSLCEMRAKTGQTLQMFETPVQLTFLFHDNLDCSNHAAIAKMIEDALKGVLIKDDSPKYVRSMTIGFHDEHYIRVLVEPYKPFQGV